MLHIKDVTVQNGSFSLSLDLPPMSSGIYAMIGPSGGGKSTALASIAGFQSLRSGAIFWQGRDISTDPPARRPVAILFQDNNLFPHLSIERNVALALTPRKQLTIEQRSKVSDALDRVGLSAHGEKKPAALSGGQQSRAALARILLQDKPILLLDEPFSALGPALRQDMLDLVAEIARERQTTVIMVTHTLSDATRIAKDIIFIDHGKADHPVATPELLENPPEALKQYLGNDAGST